MPQDYHGNQKKGNSSNSGFYEQIFANIQGSTILGSDDIEDVNISCHGDRSVVTAGDSAYRAQLDSY
ncbi:MAG: hypothetical protein QNJ70_31145 [Xenococcaceae cyanobacterium MO_207.B15]|nr:hypothetical protein [Xenococcaceae cyanobacterium MO_207.B15]